MTKNNILTKEISQQIADELFNEEKLLEGTNLNFLYRFKFVGGGEYVGRSKGYDVYKRMAEHFQGALSSAYDTTTNQRWGILLFQSLSNSGYDITHFKNKEAQYTDKKWGEKIKSVYDWDTFQKKFIYDVSSEKSLLSVRPEFSEKDKYIRYKIKSNINSVSTREILTSKKEKIKEEENIQKKLIKDFNLNSVTKISGKQESITAKKMQLESWDIGLFSKDSNCFKFKYYGKEYNLVDIIWGSGLATSWTKSTGSENIIEYLITVKEYYMVNNFDNMYNRKFGDFKKNWNELRKRYDTTIKENLQPEKLKKNMSISKFFTGNFQKDLITVVANDINRNTNIYWSYGLKVLNKGLEHFLKEAKINWISQTSNNEQWGDIVIQKAFKQLLILNPLINQAFTLEAQENEKLLQSYMQNNYK